MHPQWMPLCYSFRVGISLTKTPPYNHITWVDLVLACGGLLFSCKNIQNIQIVGSMWNGAWKSQQLDSAHAQKLQAEFLLLIVRIMHLTASNCRVWIDDQWSSVDILHQKCGPHCCLWDWLIFMHMRTCMYLELINQST